jgi:hypothetical protein
MIFRGKVRGVAAIQIDQDNYTCALLGSHHDKGARSPFTATVVSPLHSSLWRSHTSFLGLSLAAAAWEAFIFCNSSHVNRCLGEFIFRISSNTPLSPPHAFSLCAEEQPLYMLQTQTI